MLMPVVYETSLTDPREHSYMDKRECRSCGDPAMVKVFQHNFPHLVNWRHGKNFQFARLEWTSKCVWCYM